MLDLMQDLVALLGLVAAAVGAGGVALVIAKQVGVDAQILRRFAGSRRTPEGTLRLLIDCAEVAAREGLLQLEARVAAASEPLLARGVALALEGRSEAELRKVLDDELETAALRGAARARILALLGAIAQIGGIVLAVGLLIACLALASGLSGSVPGILLLLGGTTGLLAIVAGSLWSDAAGVARAADVLCDLIIAEGILMLRAGRDAGAVQQKLGRLLPPERPTRALARAA